MAIDILKTVDIIEIMENYLEKIRPPESIRKQLDLSYKIEDQSVILTEVRPIWNQPGEYVEYGYAKTTFVKNKNIWKIFWLQANLKWFAYEPTPQVSSLKEFLKIVHKDKHHCFKG